jgi:hypothetical protein
VVRGHREESEIPSLGGLATFAVLLHDLDADTVTRHDLRHDLEPTPNRGLLEITF